MTAEIIPFPGRRPPEPPRDVDTVLTLHSPIAERIKDIHARSLVSDSPYVRRSSPPGRYVAEIQELARLWGVTMPPPRRK